MSDYLTDAMPIRKRHPDNSDAPIALARRFYQIARARLAEVQEPLGLRPLEFGLMIRVHDAPGIDQNTVAEQLALDRTSTGALAARLEAVGLLARTVSDLDRRARALVLTNAGHALHDRHRPESEAVQAAMLASLTAEEQQTLTALLVRVIGANATYVRPGAGRRKPVRRPETVEAR